VVEREKDMTHTYRIDQQVSGAELGEYQGETKDQALDAMAQDQGYADYDALLEVTGETRDTDTLTVTEIA
jgi:hypothetical protein